MLRFHTSMRAAFAAAALVATTGVGFAQGPGINVQVDGPAIVPPVVPGTPGQVRREIRREARRISRDVKLYPPAAVISVAPTVRTEYTRIPVVDVVRHESQNKHFTTFAKAVKAADLEEVLRGPGPITVFAPTDEAFKQLPEGELAALMQDKKQLRALLLNHVVEGEKVTTQEKEDVAVRTAGELDVTVYHDGDRTWANEAVVVIPDVATVNGVLQGIDRVLTPRREAAAPTPAGVDPANPDSANAPANPPRGASVKVEVKRAPDDRSNNDRREERREDRRDD